MGVWLGPRGGNVAPIEIYKAGDQNTFTPVAYSIDESNPVSPTADYLSDQMQVKEAMNSYGRNNSGLLVHNHVLDLTKYNSISVDYQWRHAELGRVFFYVARSNDSFENAVSILPEKGDSRQTATLDVSELTGNYYFGIAIICYPSNEGPLTATVYSVTATK